MVEVLSQARRYNTPVTFRAAGTSLSGQAITDSILLKLSHNGKAWRRYQIEDGARQGREPREGDEGGSHGKEPGEGFVGGSRGRGPSDASKRHVPRALAAVLDAPCRTRFNSPRTVRPTGRAALRPTRRRSRLRWLSVGAGAELSAGAQCGCGSSGPAALALCGCRLLIGSVRVRSAGAGAGSVWVLAQCRSTFCARRGEEDCA